MNDAATPGAEEPKVPVAPAAPAPAGDDSKVTLSKTEYEQLQRDAARAASAQSEKDRQAAAKKRQDSKHFEPRAPAPAPTPEQQEQQAQDEDRKAERGLVALAIDPKYREVLDADPTLRSLLTTAPLSALPILAPDAFDAEDAIGLVTSELEKRLAQKKTATPAPSAVTPPVAPATGAVNASDQAINEEYEAAKKLPGTEKAVVGMIRAGLKHMVRK